MIYNQHIKELNLNFDLGLLQQSVLLSKPIPGSPPHHRSVADNKFLSSIRNKFPFFSPVYNLLRLPENQEIPVHVDADRFCALNIPILNTSNSYTIFYNWVPPIITEYDEKRIMHRVKSNIEECFRFTLLRPTLINNGDSNHPHGVVHFGPGERVIISWSLLKSMNFNQACEFFNDDVVSGIIL